MADYSPKFKLYFCIFSTSHYFLSGSFLPAFIALSWLIIRSSHRDDRQGGDLFEAKTKRRCGLYRQTSKQPGSTRRATPSRVTWECERRLFKQKAISQLPA